MDITLPEEYRGKFLTEGGYTKTRPRAWTKEEIDFVLKKKEEGYTNKEIARITERSLVSIGIKIKRLKKGANTYNSSHVEEKKTINEEFIKFIQPKKVLDLYCGYNEIYKDYLEKNKGCLITNDIDEKKPAIFHEKAELLIHKLYYEGMKFDYIDLDPFGSAYECFDLAIKMAQKGLAITLGEYGHKRFNRLDYVGSHYGIENIGDFTSLRLVSHIQRIGERNKKKLTIYKLKEWQNICRVWFTIDTIKVTEQWEKKQGTLF